MNLRPAPFALTPRAVARLIGDDTSGTGTVPVLPVLPVRLVDRPRRSEDPRLARANDDNSWPEVAQRSARPTEGSDALQAESAPAVSSASLGSIAGSNPAPANQNNDGGARG